MNILQGDLMAVGITVGSVMKKAVVTAKKEDTIEKIAKMMKKASIGSVIICDKGKVVGIITGDDIIYKVVASGKNPKKLKAKMVMVRRPKAISPETDLEDAAQIMRDWRVSKLPIVKKGKLVGIITERDLIKNEPALLELMIEKGNLEKINPTHSGINISGYCENCGNYSDILQFVQGRYLCEDCRRL